MTPIAEREVKEIQLDLHKFPCGHDFVVENVFDFAWAHVRGLAKRKFL